MLADDLFKLMENKVLEAVHSIHIERKQNRYVMDNISYIQNEYKITLDYKTCKDCYTIKCNWEKEWND